MQSVKQFEQFSVACENQIEFTLKQLSIKEQEYESAMAR